MQSFNQCLSFLLNKAGVRFFPEKSLKAGKLGVGLHRLINLVYALTGQISLPVGYTSITVGVVGQHFEELMVISKKDEETALIIAELRNMC